MSVGCCSVSTACSRHRCDTTRVGAARVEQLHAVLSIIRRSILRRIGSRPCSCNGHDQEPAHIPICSAAWPGYAQGRTTRVRAAQARAWCCSGPTAGRARTRRARARPRARSRWRRRCWAPASACSTVPTSRSTLRWGPPLQVLAFLCHFCGLPLRGMTGPCQVIGSHWHQRKE